MAYHARIGAGAILLLLSSPLLSCQLLFPVDVDEANTQDAGDAGSDASDAAGGGCPGSAGPVAVRIGGFCIDSTEVTKRQYAAFVAALDGGVPSATSPFCVGRSILPSSACPWPSPETQLDDPIACVDWCDAYAYCVWAGKRLCGHVDGGALNVYDQDSQFDAWYTACSAGGTRLYPYGEDYNPLACNGADREAGAPWEAGSHASCEGGYPGIFDMSGNVGEWIDACDLTDGATANDCTIRGGGFLDPTGKLGCKGGAGPSGIGRYQNVYPDVGFRCCSP